MFCLQAQDTVKYLDPWYLFHRYSDYTHIKSVGTAGDDWPVQLIEILAHKYQSQDSVVVYGIAVTANGLPQAQNEWAPEYLLHRKIGKDNGQYFVLVDSANMDTRRHELFFEYTIDTGTPIGVAVPCVEFYFETPHVFAGNDIFLISRYWNPIKANVYNTTVYPSLDSADRYFQFSGATVTTDEEWFATPERDTLFMIFPTTMSNRWGIMFPIVGLRCVAPSLRLVERGNGTATVSWTQAEAGVGYELSFGPYGTEPDSGTIVGTTDTSYTLTGLESGVREAVWVRKACRYDVYDSTVWSEWSLPLVFLTLGVDEVEGEAVRLQVRDGAVAVVGAADGEEVKLYDALGRQVAAARAAAGTETLLAAPAAGVYTVRIGSQSARRVVLTR